MSEERDLTPTVVGICRGCKRVVFASVNDAEANKNDLAREVARLVRDGFEIQEWPVEKVRAAEWMCKCPKKSKQKKAA